jgi:hypothetical protein
MKNLLVVCLILPFATVGSAYSSSRETFTLADRVGEPNARSFFLFSTSAGNYTLRHDGMGEVSSPKGMRRVFYVKVGPKSRLDRVYYLEHEGDLLLLCEVRGQGFYLMRMEQKKRKLRWFTPLPDVSLADQDPVVNGDAVFIGTTTMISKNDGRIVKQD